MVTGTVAGLGRRLFAMLYEGLIVFAIALAAGLVFSGAASGRLGGVERHVFQVYMFLVLGMYFVYCWRRSGRTLAMQTWKLKLVTRDGERLGLGRAWLRYSLAWPSLLLAGAGLLWALVDRDGQFLHDRLAGTRIIQE